MKNFFQISRDAAGSENPQSGCQVLRGDSPRARLFRCGSEMETGSGAEQSCPVLPSVAAPAPATQSRPDLAAPAHRLSGHKFRRAKWQKAIHNLV